METLNRTGGDVQELGLGHHWIRMLGGQGALRDERPGEPTLEGACWGCKSEGNGWIPVRDRVTLFQARMGVDGTGAGC